MAILAGSGLETSLPDRMYGNNDVRGNGANAETADGHAADRPDDTSPRAVKVVD